MALSFLVFILTVFACNVHAQIPVPPEAFQPASYLRNRAPYFHRQAGQDADTPYSIALENYQDSYSMLTSMTGLTLRQTDFTASWYVFNRPSEIPGSITEILNLVNQKKPLSFSQLSKNNELWQGQAEIPVRHLGEESRVFVYISIISRSGILIPVSSQGFYHDPIAGTHSRSQSTAINLDLVRFWYDRGYFAYNVAAQDNPQ